MDATSYYLVVSIDLFNGQQHSCTKWPSAFVLRVDVGIDLLGFVGIDQLGAEGGGIDLLVGHEGFNCAFRGPLLPGRPPS